MNELSQNLLEAAWQSLPAKKRTVILLKKEAESDWYIWRNYQVEAMVVAFLPTVQARPVTDYYPEVELGDRILEWLERGDFYSWEIPIYDGEDDDFVYTFTAHCIGVWTWLAFEPAWEQFDATEAEIEDFYNFKMNYAPRSKNGVARRGQRAAVNGDQLSFF